MNPYRLFKMSKGTFDITDFASNYRERGINLFKITKNINFSITEE